MRSGGFMVQAWRVPRTAAGILQRAPGKAPDRLCSGRQAARKIDELVQLATRLATGDGILRTQHAGSQ